MYEFEEGMREIGGLGEAYEKTCQKMVIAGLEWFDEHPEADPRFSGYKVIYGVLSEDNDDAKKLSEVVIASVDDCTGGMHHATISHILHIHEVGWETYVQEMKQADDTA